MPDMRISFTAACVEAEEKLPSKLLELRIDKTDFGEKELFLINNVEDFFSAVLVSEYELAFTNEIVLKQKNKWKITDAKFMGEFMLKLRKWIIFFEKSLFV